MNDLAHYLRHGTLQLAALPPLSLYVHLPWCLRKCPYCDFNSHEMASGQVPQQAYIEALLADLDQALPLVWGRPVHSIFFGGGTPSLFTPEAMDALLGQLRARLKWQPDCEVTLEANPGTFEKDRFRQYRQAGINRLSLGVQSFDEEALVALGRVHDRAQAVAAAEEAAQCFETFNLDLMYAWPGQSLVRLQADLDQALSLSPPHLSVYHLTLEPNTYFARFPPALPDEDLAYEMLDCITERMVGAGLERYEVSAYARPGHRCVHNLNYWQFGDYLGIGAGAHSKLSFAHRVVRQVRVREPRLYMERARSAQAVAQEHEVSRADLPFEFMLNALRLTEGFERQRFGERTGLAPAVLQKPMERALAQGLLSADLQRIGPTARGLDFLNDLQALFLPDTGDP